MRKLLRLPPGRSDTPTAWARLDAWSAPRPGYSVAGASCSRGGWKPPLRQSRDWFAVIDVVRSIRFVVPDGRSRQAEGLIDRRGHVFGRLRIGGRVAAIAVGRANDRAALHTAAG